jgi:hypothetical protein
VIPNTSGTKRVIRYCNVSDTVTLYWMSKFVYLANSQTDLTICHLISCPVLPATVSVSIHHYFCNMVNITYQNTNKTQIYKGPTLRISAWCWLFMEYWNVMGLLVNFQLTELFRSPSARYCRFYCMYIWAFTFRKELVLTFSKHVYCSNLSLVKIKYNLYSKL